MLCRLSKTGDVPLASPRKKLTNRASAHRFFHRLSNTYKTQDGETVSKRDVYQDYLDFCADNSIPSTNPSTFGKILKIVRPLYPVLIGFYLREKIIIIRFFLFCYFFFSFLSYSFIFLFLPTQLVIVTPYCSTAPFFIYLLYYIILYLNINLFIFFYAGVSQLDEPKDRPSRRQLPALQQFHAHH